MKRLWEDCKTIRTFREALLKKSALDTAAVPNEKEVNQWTENLSGIITTIEEIAAKKQETGHNSAHCHLCCSDEFKLAAKEFYIYLVRHKLDLSLSRLEKIYDAKNNLQPKENEPYKRRNSQFAGLDKKVSSTCFLRHSVTYPATYSS